MLYLYVYHQGDDPQVETGEPDDDACMQIEDGELSVFRLNKDGKFEEASVQDLSAGDEPDWKITWSVV